MPMPLSFTENDTHSPGAAETRSSTEPSWVNLSAFESRLRTIC